MWGTAADTGTASFGCTVGFVLMVIVGLRIRIKNKDLRIASLISSRDLLQMQSSLLQRAVRFHELQSE